MTEDKLEERLDRIEAQLDLVIHGNGRAGIWKISDYIFGKQGVKERLEALEAHDLKLDRERATSRAYQRGIAIGLALVAGNTFFGVQVNIPELLSRLLSR